MTRSLFSVMTLALALASPQEARAQSAPSGPDSCPPGSWFCAEPPPSQPPPAGQPVEPLRPLPPPEQAAEPPVRVPPPPPKPPRRRPPPPPPPYPYSSTPPYPPPGVAYEAPPPTLMGPPGAPPPDQYSRSRRVPMWPTHEWGLNLHLEGAMIGGGQQGNAGLGGGGAGLRFKPVPAFGMEADLDFAGGAHDYQGNQRSETAFTLNALLFLNPRSHAQIYLLAGFGWSGAHVTCDGCATPLDNHYDYFGGQIGAGLELRMVRAVAFNLDVRGFMRGRTDALAQTQPEFDQPAGCSSNPSAYATCRSTNSSGGGLLTAGMTLYF